MLGFGIRTCFSCAEDSETNLLYGGSFKRFMQVADVGNRSRASSEALPAALYEQSNNKFHKVEKEKGNLEKKHSKRI